MYLHIYTYVYTYIHICTQMYTYIHIYTHIYTYIHIYMACSLMCDYDVYKYIYIYTHIYTYIHMYTHIYGMLPNVCFSHRVLSPPKQYRLCSLTIECVLFLWNVFSYDRMCSLTAKCVLLR